jgi:hypothetical protein
MTTSEQNVHEFWTDVERVQNYTGTFSLSDFLIVLLSMEYTKGEGAVTLANEEKRSVVVFQKGKIVDVYGFGNLLPDDLGAIPKGLKLGDFVGLAMSKGIAHDQVMQRLRKNLSKSILSTKMNTISVLSFEKPKIPMKLGISVVKLIEMGIEESFVIQSPKRRYRNDLNSSVFMKLPEGVSLPRLALPPVALRMIRSISSETRLCDIAESKGDWFAFHLLHLLGLLQIEPTEQSQSSQLSEQAGENEKVLAKLKDWLEGNVQKESHVLLEISQPNELNPITISQKARTISSKLHPDRFVGNGDKVQVMAQRCFEIVSAAEQKLTDEAYLTELKSRLDAEARGEVYVSESAEKKSHLLYEKAKFLFRRNKVDETQEIVDQAYTLNPYYWRLNYLRLQLSYKRKSMPELEIAEILLKIEGCKGHERLDILCFAAELFHTSEKHEHREKSKEILKMIRAIDPEFQRAKILQRRIKRAKEKPPETKDEKKGFFSSLFKR